LRRHIERASMSRARGLDSGGECVASLRFGADRSVRRRADEWLVMRARETRRFEAKLTKSLLQQGKNGGQPDVWLS
jgi:hypothetical protein